MFLKATKSYFFLISKATDEETSFMLFILYFLSSHFQICNAVLRDSSLGRYLHVSEVPLS